MNKPTDELVDSLILLDEAALRSRISEMLVWLGTDEGKQQVKELITAAQAKLSSNPVNATQVIHCCLQQQLVVPGVLSLVEAMSLVLALQNLLVHDNAIARTNAAGAIRHCMEHKILARGTLDGRQALSLLDTLLSMLSDAHTSGCARGHVTAAIGMLAQHGLVMKQALPDYSKVMLALSRTLLDGNAEVRRKSASAIKEYVQVWGASRMMCDELRLVLLRLQLTLSDADGEARSNAAYAIAQLIHQQCGSGTFVASQAKSLLLALQQLLPDEHTTVCANATRAICYFFERWLISPGTLRAKERRTLLLALQRVVTAPPSCASGYHLGNAAAALRALLSREKVLGILTAAEQMSLVLALQRQLVDGNDDTDVAAHARHMAAAAIRQCATLGLLLPGMLDATQTKALTLALLALVRSGNNAFIEAVSTLQALADNGLLFPGVLDAAEADIAAATLAPFLDAPALKHSASRSLLALCRQSIIPLHCLSRAQLEKCCVTDFFRAQFFDNDWRSMVRSFVWLCEHGAVPWYHDLTTIGETCTVALLKAAVEMRLASIVDRLSVTAAVLAAAGIPVSSLPDLKAQIAAGPTPDITAIDQPRTSSATAHSTALEQSSASRMLAELLRRDEVAGELEDVEIELAELLLAERKAKRQRAGAPTAHAADRIRVTESKIVVLRQHLAQLECRIVRVASCGVVPDTLCRL